MPGLGTSFFLRTAVLFWTCVIGHLLGLLVLSTAEKSLWVWGSAEPTIWLSSWLTRQCSANALCPDAGSKGKVALVEHWSHGSCLTHHKHTLPCHCYPPGHVWTLLGSKSLEAPKSHPTVLLLTSLITLFDIWCLATLICVLLLYPELIKRQENWLVLADNEVCVYESGVCLLGASALPWLSFSVVSPVVPTPGELPGAWKKSQLCSIPALHRTSLESGPESCLITLVRVTVAVTLSFYKKFKWGNMLCLRWVSHPCTDYKQALIAEHFRHTPIRKNSECPPYLLDPMAGNIFRFLSYCSPTFYFVGRF